MELLDLYPTLVELTPLPRAAGWTDKAWCRRCVVRARTRPAITTVNQGNHAVRTADWRYIRYADGSRSSTTARADPNEWTNLAKDPEYRATDPGAVGVAAQGRSDSRPWKHLRR